jgi:hypothetical protein
MTHYIFKKLLYLSLFLYAQTLIPSILANTLIKTPSGFASIENVTLNTPLISYSPNQSVVEVIPNHITSTTIQNIVILSTDIGNVATCPDQLFYNPITASWIKAQDITPGVTLLTYSNYCICTAIEIIAVPPTNIYHLSTTYPHTFFITEQELLTHNMFPLAAISMTWLFGEGITFSFGTILTGTLFGIKLYKERNKEKPSITFVPSTEGSSANCNWSPDPDDDKHKKRKFNTMSKSEFFKKVSDDYEHWRDGIYRRKSRANGLDKNTEYLKWDHLHNDVEAFSKGGTHLGSYDPATLELYKGPVFGRTL